MHILMVSYLPIHPANAGGRVRIRQLATNLAREHRVTVVCPPLEELPDAPLPFEIEEAAVRGARQLFDPRSYGTVISAARAARPDCILLEYVWQGAHAALASRAIDAPVLLDAFDVASVRFRRAGAKYWPLIGAYERLVLRMPHRVYAVSNDDRTQLVRLGAPAGRTSVVPNGVDTATFRPDPQARRRVRAELGLADGERMLFFFGQLGYAPNAAAVRTLEKEIMPRLDGRFRLFVAGPGQPPIASNGRIAFLGSVDALPDYINAADSMVAPVMSGSGTRIKLLESIASGAPTVATSIAAEGIDREACGDALHVRDGWDGFAEAVRDVAGQGNTPPPATFVQRYDWRRIVERMQLN